MNDFLSLRKFITPALIPLVFWIGSIWVIIADITFMFKVSFWVGLVKLIFGLVLVRIFAEVLVVLFRMHDALVKMAPAQTKTDAESKPQ